MFKWAHSMGIRKKEIKRLFERRPTIEIMEISPKEREMILRKAESLMLKMSSNLAINGGDITDFEKALARSLFEMFVRNEAMEKINTTIMAAIDFNIYNEAFKSFNEFIKQADIVRIREQWMKEIKSYASTIFVRVDKVFEPYLIGELCERLYLDNRFAKAVLEELKNENFVQVVDRQYQQNLIEKSS